MLTVIVMETRNFKKTAPTFSVAKFSARLKTLKSFETEFIFLKIGRVMQTQKNSSLEHMKEFRK